MMLKKRLILSALLFAVGIVWAGNSLAGAAEAVPPYKDAKLPVEQRVNDLLGRMTLEEKIQYVSGVDSQFIRDIPRLGLQRIDMEDGPLGVHKGGTAFPPGLALSASYDPDLAHAWGVALGRDCRALGVHVTLGPGMNIARSPLLGRSCEYFGEDPFLAAHMVPSVIQGVQSQGVMACAKHFIGNEMELVRTYSDSQIDERTLREIYLPAFEAAVHEGKVASIMGAYNHINGEHACVNHHTLKDILRDDYGYKGIILSDWGAGSGPADIWAPGPLDIAMPEGPMGDPKIVLPMIKDKKIDPKVYDEKVRHLLTKCMEFGFFDRPQKDPSVKANDPAAQAVARRVSEEGMVLLKNKRGLLPLDRSAIHSIAVLGPNADRVGDGTPYATGISGSSWQDVENPVTVVQGIRALVGDSVKVVTAPDPTRTVFATTAYEHIGADGKPAPGMLARYYKNGKLEGKPALERVDKDLNFGSNWRNKGWLTELQPLDYTKFSVSWEGQIKPAKGGQYRFVKECNPGMKVWLDDQLILDDVADFAQTHWLRLSAGVVKELQAGKTYKLKIEYLNDPELLAHMWGVRFGWGPVEESAAAKVAKSCDVAVVCVGFDYATEGEGIDRSFALPYGQAELIRDVAQANPRTIVVLTGGGACETKEWINRVPAMLHAWYFAEKGGEVVADILFGKINPSGKLPVTFDKDLADNPATPYFKADWSKKGSDLPIKYTEGVFVGYRGYDKSGKTPLFPFGHGLSYTTFKYSGLKVSAGKAGKPVTVTCTVKNTGKLAGAEVVQLYVGDTHAPVPRPVRELKGFKRVELKPGEKQTVSFTLAKRDFSYYDVNAKGWRVAPGKFQISVGSSSRDLRLNGPCNLENL